MKGFKGYIHVTVYTHRPRVYLPWWALVFALPFYALYGALRISAAALVVIFRASVWAMRSVVR